MQGRPLPVTAAAVLLALISLAGLPGPLLPGSEVVPAVVLYSGIVLGVAGLIAAVGLWLLKRWSFWLTIVVSALNLLSAAPGIAFAPAQRSLLRWESWFPPSSSCWSCARSRGGLWWRPEPLGLERQHHLRLADEGRLGAADPKGGGSGSPHPHGWRAPGGIGS